MTRSVSLSQFPQFIVPRSFSTRVCLRVRSTEGADLALAAAPHTAGLGKAHQHTAVSALVLAQGLEDLVGDEGSDGPAVRAAVRHHVTGGL